MLENADRPRYWMPFLAILLAIAMVAVAMAQATSAPGPAGVGPAGDSTAVDPDLTAGLGRAVAQAPTGPGQITGGATTADLSIPVGLGPNGFTAPARLGFPVGDQWEPAIAADKDGHVYVLYPQYVVVPDCPACALPTMVLTTSADSGSTWTAPRLMYPAGDTTGQWDAQLAVDPVGGHTVYAAWLQNNKSSVAVARSDDYGLTWTTTLADSTNAGTDKPILAVRGQDVYVAYNHAQTVWVSASHDGGRTWMSTKVNANGKLGWSLAGGGTVDPSGGIHFSWAGYTRNGGAKGPVNLYVSNSYDGGRTWSTTVLGVSSSPPDCSAFDCGWAFLGAQATMTSDAAGTLYAFWHEGTTPQGPERLHLARSTDGGRSWTELADPSQARAGTDHAFPAIAAGAAGDVRIAWMDDRASSGLWNVWYRSSTDGGASWSAEERLSTGASGYSYITPNGFSFPFGDYFEMDIDGQGRSQVVWGNGADYDTPGSIWYVRGK
jgi:BNR repeat-like domain